MVFVTETRADVAAIREALAAEFGVAVNEARARLAAILEPALPTVAFLAALASELNQAEADSRSVPYPELADPDQYWHGSVKPQMRTLREQVAAIVEWLDDRVVAAMEIAERELNIMVDEAVNGLGINHLADRAELERLLHERCSELHRQMAKLLQVLPDPAPFAAVRAAYSENLRAQAVNDVDALKLRYLAEAGGDEAHQRFAEQQWSETYGDRVTHRLAMLAAISPWRHQELALVGYERTLADCEAAVEESITRLQSPLGGLPGLLLERFDRAIND